MSGAAAPPAAYPLGRLSTGCSCCGCGDPAPVPQRAPLRASVARCGGGGRASPRGCLSPLRGASGVPCSPGELSRSFTHVLWARGCGCGGPALSPRPACPVGAVYCGGGGGPSPGGVACHRCEGHLVSGAVPPPVARPLGGPLGSATHMLWARVSGCGGPALSPRPACPVGAACRRIGGGPPPGGVACHCCEGRVVSGAGPPPSRPPSGAGSQGSATPCVPGAVGAGVGTQHRFHSVRPCGSALLAVGVAEGRPRGGRLPLL